MIAKKQLDKIARQRLKHCKTDRDFISAGADLIQMIFKSKLEGKKDR